MPPVKAPRNVCFGRITDMAFQQKERPPCGGVQTPSAAAPLRCNTILIHGAPSMAAAQNLAALTCGFLTLEQRRATVSGVGGSCEPNQFYNPRRSPSQGHRPNLR
jgi:hypothetical protein